VSSKLHQLSVYYPQQQGRAIKARAISVHGSISRYLKFLIEQDQAAKGDPVQAEVERLGKLLDELLEFSRYNMVVQNATADRLSPGLLDDIQTRYRAKFGSAPDAR
jgi:hypothetical protein